MLTKKMLDNAELKDKLYKINIGQGLYVVVYPTGRKVFRRDYVFLGKRKTLTFGEYPNTSINDAIKQNVDAREMVAKGIDPSEIKSIAKKSNQLNSEKILSDKYRLQSIALQWWFQAMKSRTKGYAQKVKRNLEMYVFPWIGDKHVGEIKLSELISLLRKIEEANKGETAHRVSTILKNVFRYARQQDIEGVLVLDDDLKGALSPLKENNYPSFTKPRDVGLLLQSFDDFKGTFTVKCALLLTPYVFTRPGELRKAKWSDIDFEHKMWRFKATKKRAEDRQEYHVVPLSRQAVKILLELKEYSNGSEFVFVGNRSKDRPMSDAAVNTALRSLGWNTSTDFTGHGVRAMAKTLLQERLNFSSEIVEHQLAHRVADTLGTAYNRTKHIEDRIHMMQVYADYLDKLKATDWSKVSVSTDEIYG